MNVSRTALRLDRLLPALIPLMIFAAGCHIIKSPGPPPVGSSVSPLRDDSGPAFKDVATAAGVRYRWSIPGPRPMNILQTIGNGCAFLDYDADGKLDILLVGPHLALYRGDGHGHFTDVTASARLDRVRGQFLGCAVGDYDNDGYEDIYLSAYQGGVLLHNEGGTWFRDVTGEAGIQAQPWGTSCSFADVNNDGKLDLYVGDYIRFGSHDPQLCKLYGVMTACPPYVYLPAVGALYINLGHGRFRDATRTSGAALASGRALGAAFMDLEGSNRQSLYIANDGSPGDLLVNHLINNKGTFRNQGVASGTAYDANGHPHAGMGCDWGDYDNDGRQDLVVGTFQNEPDSVYHNLGDGQFADLSGQVGVARLTLHFLTFGAKWLDYDNDGWLDLVFANGHVRDNPPGTDVSTTFRQTTLLLHNDHGASFSDVSRAAGEAFQRPIVGRGLAVGDFDNDGKMDLLVVDSDGAPLLLHNECRAAHHWLGVHLVGTRSNRDGVGAMITVEAGGLKQVRRCGVDGSYLSASDPRVHFGLSSHPVASTVSIRWPSGTTTSLHNVPADQYLLVREAGSR